MTISKRISSRLKTRAPQRTQIISMSSEFIARTRAMKVHFTFQWELTASSRFRSGSFFDSKLWV